MTDNIFELTAEEMDLVSGGYKRPPEKDGFIIYQISKGENLTRIANAHKCTVNEILVWNPKIKDKNKIYAGDYLYLKNR